MKRNKIKDSQTQMRNVLNKSKYSFELFKDAC